MSFVLVALLTLLDKLACAWLDWRQSQNVEQMKRDMPEMAQEMGLHRVDVGSREWKMVMQHPGVYLMADMCAAFLEANNAKNYVQFDMMPRLDRGKRPIRMTVMWASGESPAQKASRLERELDELRAAELIRRYSSPQYWLDSGGRLWHGPTCPEGNLHYATFEGFNTEGGEIWVAHRSDEPENSTLVSDERVRGIINAAKATYYA